MGRVRKLARRVAERIARRVARHDLFEKPGERAPTAPLPSDDDAASEEPPLPEGPPVRLGDLAALLQARASEGRPVVVHHWATWCAPCAEELPRVQALHEAMGDAGRLVGVSWDLFEAVGAPEQVADDVSEFARDAGITWGSLLITDEPGAFLEQSGLAFDKIPQSQVYDAAGNLILDVHGALDDDALAKIHALLGV
ncbi:MAG: TlpA family protein disulfide reductase [Alphaproteobacteria bacterium]|nr:TlpA family protein disulfide reductase [Alphaproteobacteria bacterium]